MLSYMPTRHPRVLVVTDAVSLNDSNINRQRGHQPPGKQSVLQNWWLGKEVFKREWSEVGRIALFDFHQEVSTDAKRKALAELKRMLTAAQADIIICLATPSRSAKKLYDDAADTGTEHAGTLCWDVFDPPGTIAGSRDKSGCGGTFWDSVYGRVLALPNPANLDYVYLDPLTRWLGWARDGRPTLQLPTVSTFTEPGEAQNAALRRLRETIAGGAPLTFDLETFSTEDLVTCIGLTDGETTVSVPWDPFVPYGASQVEPGASEEAAELVRAIFKASRVVVGHNILGHDVPFLRQRKFKLPDRMFDTYIAHHVTQSQLKHGLQAVTSYFEAIPPWKTVHQRSARESGLDPAYDARAWIQNPKELRGYNAQDTFYNSTFAEPLASRCGMLL